MPESRVKGNFIVISNVDGSNVANKKPFRFSTKWLDTELAAAGQTGAIGETGLYYYGIRYLSPGLGRWTSNDPIAEQGGLNLYGFVRNGPTDSVDPDGRATLIKTYCAKMNYWWSGCIDCQIYQDDFDKANDSITCGTPYLTGWSATPGGYGEVDAIVGPETDIPIGQGKKLNLTVFVRQCCGVALGKKFSVLVYCGDWHPASYTVCSR